MSAADRPREDPPRRAIALRYEPAGSGVPEIAAKGSGPVADRILDVARAHGVPIREDPDLVALLAACEVGEDVPVELYVAVAELLAFLWEMRDR